MRRLVMAGALALGVALTVGATPVAAQKGDRYKLTIDEIRERSEVTDAYDAVRRLRSQWLRPARSTGRLGSSANAADGGTRGDKVEPVVYIDDVRQHNLQDALRSVRVGEINEIDYMNGTQASGRYGAGHEAGAILVKTNRLGG